MNKEIVKVRAVNGKDTSVVVLETGPTDGFDALADSEALFYHLRDVLPTATMDALVHRFEQHGIQKRRGLW